MLPKLKQIVKDELDSHLRHRPNMGRTLTGDDDEVTTKVSLCWSERKKRCYALLMERGSGWSATACYNGKHTCFKSFRRGYLYFLHCFPHEVNLIIKDCFIKEQGIPELYELTECHSTGSGSLRMHAPAS